MPERGARLSLVHAPRRAAALFGVGLIALVSPAAAQVTVCNASSSRIGVALAYQDPSGWTSEGWWNIPSQSCETLLKTQVPSRFIYVHAVDYDRGGDWSGTNMLCTAEKSFAIREADKCAKTGNKSSGFFEVDTGDAKEWTIRLSDPDDQGGKGR
ncbi:MAG: DUF1036 domain-containing protein [Hyphomicrobiaceae bacterium]|nr:DUF1036 domain-containing protein [Hyphomicrobiaceae bacterium]